MKTKVEKINKEALLELHHKVRTPLNVILGFVQVLNSDSKFSKDERILFYGIIDEEVDHLLIYLESIIKSQLK